MKYRFRNWRLDAEAIASAIAGRVGPSADVLLAAIAARCGVDVAVYAATSVKERSRFERSLARSGVANLADVSRLGEKYCRRAMPRRQFNSMILYYRVIDILAAM